MDTTSINELSTSEAAFAGGFIGAFAVFAVIICVILIIAEWRIFEKAGEKGWKSLIPIYSQYILFKIIGSKTWFWVFLGVSLVCTIVMSVNNLPVDFNASQEEVNAQLDAIEWKNYIPYVVSLIIYSISAFATYVMVCVKTAKAFGKGSLYAVGLFWFPEIVLMVLGFGKAKYSAKNLK